MRHHLVSVSVRPFVSSDAPGIEAVVASGIATLRQIYRPSPEVLARRAALPALPRLVALAADQIVGTVEYALAKERLHVMGLFVLASHRRHGVARAIVDVLAELAAPLPLSLDTIRETGNVPIFERLGFVVVREQPARDFVSERFRDLIDVYLERPSLA
jgi:GNAT superfamily N-acetyltransferase